MPPALAHVRPVRFPRRRGARPRVSVIIASYQWPEALQISLDSVLTQTIQDLEVLVVEDGPDRASRAVVGAAKDRRVLWMQLRTGCGSQWGPNNLGRLRARAPVVAYLGHDDVWHPEHLERLLDKLDDRTVDAAHAVTLLLGAGEDDRLLLAGMSSWEPSSFVPPSSLAHWRDSFRIGPWTAPEHSGMPVDYAFLLAAHMRGARFVSTGAATVFKHPASWRLDCYRTRDVSPQRQLRQRLRADPGLGERLVNDALAAGAPAALGAPPAAPPGVIADYNRRLKGLPARFGPPLTRWIPNPSLPFPGWHGVEYDGTGDAFAWTGRGPRAVVRLDAPDSRELGVRVTLRHVVTRSQLDALVVDVDGDTVELSEESRRPGGQVVMSGWLHRGACGRTVEVGLSAPLIRGTAHSPASGDTRLLGVAVAAIELLNQRPQARIAPGMWC